MKLKRTDLFFRWALFPAVFIAISLGCSTSKSAGPRTQAANNEALAQPSAPSTASVAQDETPCQLKLSDAPVINGLKLGMTVPEIHKLFPGSDADQELRTTLSSPGPLGNLSFQITPSKYGSDPNYKDVSWVKFSLLDGKVASYSIGYNGPKWPHVDKFIEKFTEQKNLPPASQWKPYVGMDDQMKTLTCDGFSVRIFEGGETGNLNYVLIQDSDADNKLKDRRKKAREQASPGPAQ